MKVVIVGAGIAGLGIGWRLLQAGAEVVVLERAQPGRGATWAAAGMISVVGESDDVNPAEHAFSWHSAKLWPSFAREIEEASGRQIRYRRDGKLIVAGNADALVHMSARKALNPELSILSNEEARALEPLLRSDIAGALYDPSEAHVDNRALGEALTEAFLRAGGVLLSNEAVVRLETAGTRVLGARTSLGFYEGNAIVLAAGAWTARLEGLPAEALPPVFPVKGEMISLAGGTPPTRIVWGDDVYTVGRGDRLLVGATASEEGFDTGLTEQAQNSLLSRAIALMPALEKWTLAEHWAGLRPKVPDGLPILGRSVLDGLFVASGQFRNGILFAPAIAGTVSAQILGHEPAIDVTAFDPRRFV
jgi:glycine oxidase